MSREPSPEQKRALEIWLKDRTKKPAEIAKEVGVSAALVRKWKSLGKWDEVPLKRTRGAPKGNKNAKNNKGGPGAPHGNERAIKHGLFRRFLPDDDEAKEIYDMTAELSPLDILWEGIRIMWTNFIRSQRIQFVTGKDEMIKELKKRKYEIVNNGTKNEPYFEPILAEEEFEFQWAWDRQATALSSQATALNIIVRKIKQYDEMLRSLPPQEVQEEQRQRVYLLMAQVDKAREEAKKAGNGTDKTPLRIEVDYGDDET